MRCIGELPSEQDALALKDYLYSKGIEVDLELDDQGVSSIWVIDEDHCAQAKKELARYIANPQDVDVVAGETQGKEERLKQERSQQKKKRSAEFRSMRSKAQLTTPVTQIFIFISVGLFLMSYMGLEKAVLNELLISKFMPMSTTHWWQSLVEIRHGQVWRLVTPIFLHFGIFHILFNMMWLFDLGSAIERAKGSLFLLLFALVVAIPSNVAQYAISGPMFGGMSGVVYALLGYVWMKSRYAPEEGLFLHPNTVIMMIAWLVLGMFGLMGHMANVVHTVGLAIGLVWGYTTSKKW